MVLAFVLRFFFILDGFAKCFDAFSIEIVLLRIPLSFLNLSQRKHTPETAHLNQLLIYPSKQSWCICPAIGGTLSIAFLPYSVFVPSAKEALVF